MPPKGKKKLTKADKAKLAAKEKAEANRAAAAEVDENGNEEGEEAGEEADAGGEEKEEKKAPAVKKPAPMKIKRVNDYRSATAVLESHVYSKDIKLGGFTLQAYGNELIKNASIELTIGRRYGLIGANGSGKSSFLRCLAAREVPIPDHLDVFMLDHEAPPSEMSALEAVVDVVKDEQKRLEALGEELLGTLGPDHEAVQLVYEKLDSLDPHTFEMRAGKLLHGLGFTLEMQRKATKDMSGGWRMRVSLARALFVRPTLLILDEPTNHLDLEACVWLEKYLSQYPFCLLMVSHSQDFLNGVCTNIMHLTENRLEYYKGNYDQFVKTKAEVEVNQMKHYQQEQDDIKHIKAFIASCGTFSNLVRQAKSKQKILDKMYAKGLTPKPTPPIRYKFEFSKCEKLPPPVMSFVDVAFAYSGQMKDALYKNVNLGVDMDSRIALVGPNGAGKSTLLKLMCADIYPTMGTVRRHLHIKIARYHQHSADQLDKAMTPLDFFVKKFEDMRQTEDEWRQHLGRYGVSGKNQVTVMGNLSDGIQSRIVFALMSLGYPNILLLDEPTNHLDMDCIDSLAEAINKFEGGMVLVSHDFRLIDQVAKTIWVCDDGDIKPWKGDIRSYKAGISARVAANEQ